MSELAQQPDVAARLALAQAAADAAGGADAVGISVYSLPFEIGVPGAKERLRVFLAHDNDAEQVLRARISPGEQPREILDRAEEICELLDCPPEGLENISMYWDRTYEDELLIEVPLMDGRPWPAHADPAAEARARLDSAIRALGRLAAEALPGGNAEENAGPPAPQGGPA